MIGIDATSTYLRLPMGLNVSCDEFQRMKMQLFVDLPFVHTFFDDIILTSNGTFEDHMAKVSQALDRLTTKNLQVNVLKSHWAKETIEYLGFILTPQSHSLRKWKR